MRLDLRDLTSAISRGAVVVAAFWLTGFLLVRLAYRLGDGWPASQVGILIACILGIYLALRLRVRFVAYLLAGQAAFGVAELSIHWVYGIRSVQGGPTHFAVMIAGTLGVLFGWYLSRRPAPRRPEESAAAAPAEATAAVPPPQALPSHAV